VRQDDSGNGDGDPRLAVASQSRQCETPLSSDGNSPF